MLQQLHALSPWRLFAATDLFRVFSVSVSAASCPSLKTDVRFCSDGYKWSDLYKKDVKVKLVS